MRLKRLLARDDEGIDAPIKAAAKKRKTDVDPRSAAVNAKITLLLTRWGLQKDSLTRHVLDNMTLAELEHMILTKYTPALNSAWKCPAELLQTHTNQVREGTVDPEKEVRS